MTSNAPLTAAKDPGWDRIAGAEIGGDVAAMVAAELGSAPAGLEREYRRFLRLAELFPEQVAPPPAIEAAWRLHGGEPLGPAYQQHWGRSDLPHFAARGKLTQIAYARYFLEKPPTAIWPEPPMPQGGRPDRSALAGGLLLVLVALMIPGERWVLKGVIGLVGLALIVGPVLPARLAPWRRGREDRSHG